MRSSVALAALLAVVPGIVHADSRRQAAPDGAKEGHAAEPAPKLPRRFEVRPPQGFRPSETPAMLADVLATNTVGGYKPHALLYSRITPSGAIVQVHSELLRSQDSREREGLKHVLGFAKSYGFSITADEATVAERAALKAALTEIGADGLMNR
jgi:hypothetical protein